MALALLNEGFEVTLYSDRTPQSLYETTPPTGTAVMYGEAIAVERRFGLDTYQDVAPPIAGMTGYLLPEPGVELMHISGSFGEYTGVGVDTRIRSFERTNELIRRGGTFVVDEVTTETIDEIAAAHDLTFVATGKGGLSGLFARDEQRSRYSEPQRYLAMITVTGVPVDESTFAHRGNDDGLRNILSVVGSMGESICCPFLHKTAGPSWSFLGLARPGSEWERRLSTPADAAEMLAAVQELHHDHLPWDWPVVQRMEVVAEDRFSWLKGRVLPSVRAAVGLTSEGRPVMSLGDTSLAFDPVGAQGAQSGMKQAGHYIDAIKAHSGPYDEAWMTATFDDYYRRFGHAANLVTSLFLEQAAGGPVNETLISAANGDSRVADALYQMLAAPQKSLPLESVEAALDWIASCINGSDPHEVLARAANRIEEAMTAHRAGKPYFTQAAEVEVEASAR
nr:styrene monooxygenase/indole monooxygenase family protein [Nocardia cyriacigeorgica]